MTEPNVLTIDGQDLRGMLADLERTASRDQYFPALRGILLFTETTAPEPNRLYGTSTDRHILGQAWEPCEGSLARCFITLESSKILRTLLDQADPGRDVTLLIKDLGAKRRALELHVDHVGASTVLIDDDAAGFPDLHKLFAGYDNTPGVPEVELGAALLNTLAAVGRRRTDPLRFRLGQNLRPATIDIGPNYRAMLMPIKPASQPEEFRYATPPGD